MSATARFAFRIDQKEKKRIQKISKEQKITSSELIKRAIEYYLKEIVSSERESITLTRDEYVKLLSLLLSDATPNERLSSAAAEYRRLIKVQQELVNNDH